MFCLWIDSIYWFCFIYLVVWSLGDIMYVYLTLFIFFVLFPDQSRWNLGKQTQTIACKFLELYSFLKEEQSHLCCIRTCWKAKIQLSHWWFKHSFSQRNFIFTHAANWVNFSACQGAICSGNISCSFTVLPSTLQKNAEKWNTHPNFNNCFLLKSSQ